ncbi:MAG: hypothetical protein HN740_09165, partial [Gammaproteobacteria bacterium]|nr:hypothetical protein [Gammaproteobacteria bacterium]
GSRASMRPPVRLTGSLTLTSAGLRLWLALAVDPSELTMIGELVGTRSWLSGVEAETISGGVTTCLSP